MASLADAVAQIQTAGLPVLFADTCSILDLIRAPLRPNELRHCIEAAQELLQLVCATPVRCMLVVGSFVPGEWLSHAGPVADNLRVHLQRVDCETGSHPFPNIAVDLAAAGLGFATTRPWAVNEIKKP